jgi:hypothetical protein
VGDGEVDVFPFPKFQLQPVILPALIVELSVNTVGCPKHTVVALKTDAGVGLPGFIVTAASAEQPFASTTETV